MSKILLSNKTWFANYSRIRIFLILLAITLLAGKYWEHSFFDSAVVTILLAISSSILLTILLFDYLQKPSFLEIVELDESLLLKLYQPNTNYLFYYKESAVRTLSIAKEDRLVLRIYKGILPLLDRIDFVLTRKNGETWKTNTINIGWRNSGELEDLINRLDKR